MFLFLSVMTGNLGDGQINAGGGVRNGTHIKRNLIPLQNKCFILAVQNFILTYRSSTLHYKSIQRCIYNEKNINCRTLSDIPYQ